MLWKLCEWSQVFSVRAAHWQCTYLKWRFDRSCGCLASKDARAAERWLRSAYRMARFALARQDEVLAYEAADLLKAIYGDGLARPGESAHLLQLCASALQTKQYEAAGYAMDAYKPLLRILPPAEMAALFEQFSLLAHMTKRLQAQYLSQRLALCVFEALARCGEGAWEEAQAAGADVLRLIGLDALKSGDSALFQETARRLCAFMQADAPSRVARRLGLLLAVWLHQIVKRDQPENFLVLRDLFFALRMKGAGGALAEEALLAECANLAPLVGANWRLRCRHDYLRLLLALPEASPARWRETARILTQAALLASELRGEAEGFVFLRPLLERARALLGDELRFARSESAVRRKVLFAIVGELAVCARLLARRAFSDTPDEVVMRLRDFWLACYRKEENRRVVDAFAQLLLFELVRAKPAKRRYLSPAGKALLERQLLTREQQKKLGVVS